MGIRSWLRWLFTGQEPAPEPVVQGSLPPIHTYIPLRQAAERASGIFYKTIYYTQALSDGLDPAEPVINWFGNLIASTVPVAIMPKDVWVDHRPVNQDSIIDACQNFDVVNGARQALVHGAFGERFEVAVRADFFDDFLDIIHATIRANPTFYDAKLPHHGEYRVARHDTAPNRQNTFSWEEFDERTRRSEGLALLKQANERFALVQAKLSELDRRAPAKPKPSKPKKVGRKH